MNAAGQPGFERRSLSSSLLMRAAMSRFMPFRNAGALTGSIRFVWLTRVSTVPGRCSPYTYKHFTK